MRKVLEIVVFIFLVKSNVFGIVNENDTYFFVKRWRFFVEMIERVKIC